MNKNVLNVLELILNRGGIAAKEGLNPMERVFALLFKKGKFVGRDSYNNPVFLTNGNIIRVFDKIRPRRGPKEVHKVVTDRKAPIGDDKLLPETVVESTVYPKTGQPGQYTTGFVQFEEGIEVTRGIATQEMAPSGSFMRGAKNYIMYPDRVQDLKVYNPYSSLRTWYPIK